MHAVPALDDWQLEVLSRSPSQRLKREKVERMQKYSEKFSEDMAKRHSQISRELSEDYKRQAVDKAIVEMFCSGGKYRDKNRSLVEKSKRNGDAWLQIKE